jgi:3-hydroxyacyl-[acyl-carrier-protein] dehydratase
LIASINHIEYYLPQRSPMIMVHNLLEANDEYAVTSLTILPDNIFVSQGIFSEPGLIENIAQTAAAQAGYFYRQQTDLVPAGFIAAIRNLEIMLLPSVNSEIKTTVRITNKVMNVTIIEGKVELDDELICQCEMRIFIK